MTTRIAWVDLSNFQPLTKGLETFAKKAVPYAARRAINGSAHEGRREWVKQLGARLTLRNTFTTRSLRVINATGTRVQNMQAVLGSPLDYLAKQEKGGVEHGKGGKSAPIPTSVAAGQASGAKRTRQVRRGNWLSAITLSKQQGASALTRKRRNAMAIRQAAEGKGGRVALLELGNARGLFRITGKRKVTVRMLWNFSHRSYRVPPSSTLFHTLAAIGPRLPGIHRDALIEQMKRHRILGY